MHLWILWYTILYRIAEQTQINCSIKKEEKLVREMIDISEVFKGDKKMVAFCRCWKSAKFPFCDGAHNQHNRTTGDNIGPIVVKKSVET